MCWNWTDWLKHLEHNELFVSDVLTNVPWVRVFFMTLSLILLLRVVPLDALEYFWLYKNQSMLQLINQH